MKDENAQLKEALTSINERLDSLNVVLLEQVRVISDLANQMRDIKNTVANIIGFVIFA